MIDFHVGQQIVCVDVSLPPGYQRQDLDGLTKDQIYTVRWFGADEDGDVVVRLNEIIRPLWACDFGIEIGFRATRFRPLIQTDISVFKALLTPVPSRVQQKEEAST